ncbi:hypothetical protein I7I50_11762 [Histoplasma capsulatum G186AR]|uniref:Uncharacterized protein n=1 Tax=Ajellomyces capsulatus TaxID=5037 RepID=A0A8H8D8F1_AJECA|nr:hypothetical protein I7I52_03000 [Histoplasma capsulatum]QSS70205.1 hypothetical protein I7I50_11762 [Histoplasma capsulatum G186AR]
MFMERRASQLRRVLHSGSCHHSRQEPYQAFDPCVVRIRTCGVRKFHYGKGVKIDSRGECVNCCVNARIWSADTPRTDH